MAWLIIVMIIILILLALGIFFTKKSKAKVDYYTMFVIGLIWLVIGIIFDNKALWIPGLALFIAGLINRDNWRKKRKKWKDLTKKEKKIKIVGLTFASIILIIGIITYFFVS